MKTISIQNLSSEEFATLQEMFSTVASLEFPFTESDEFDTLWDKVNDAE